VSPVRGWFARRSKAEIGALWLALTLITGVALLNKSQILLVLHRGESLSADFSSRYKLQPTVSKVKVAGVRVGTVTGIHPRPGGGARVDMALRRGIRDKLGTEPEAAIRPATLLGGPGLSAYVELRPGGRPGRFDALAIPAPHTRIPVELDRVLEVLTDQARAGLTRSNRGLDTALGHGGGEALGRILDDAPPAFGPGAGVLAALGGEQNGDLARLVDDLGRAAAALTAPGGELESVVDDLGSFASTLGDRAAEAEAATASLPETLQAARAGMAALESSLTRLEATAPAARPAVQRLEALLRRSAPVLAEATPVLADLRPVITEAGPVLDTLTPTSALLRQLLDDLDGPVLDRLNGSVVPAVLSPTPGSATRLYEQIAYLQAGLAGVLKYTDRSGALMNFYLGNSPDSLSTPPGSPVPAKASTR
jgi:phospholipid/cholesterol/gamma-HCH transport system substrate-binding protein